VSSEFGEFVASRSLERSDALSELISILLLIDMFPLFLCGVLDFHPFLRHISKMRMKMGMKSAN